MDGRVPSALARGLLAGPVVGYCNFVGEFRLPPCSVLLALLPEQQQQQWGPEPRAPRASPSIRHVWRSSGKHLACAGRGAGASLLAGLPRV